MGISSLLFSVKSNALFLKTYRLARGLIPDSYGRLSTTRIEECVFMEDNLLHLMSKLLHV